MFCITLLSHNLSSNN